MLRLYAKLVDREWGEREMPSKFPERLQEDLHKFPLGNISWSCKCRGEIILKDRFLSQLQISAMSYESKSLDQISL